MSTKKIQILGSLASSDITVDAELSRTSTNPVQNRVVNAAIDNLNNLIGDTAVAAQISNALNKKIGKNVDGVSQSVTPSTTSVGAPGAEIVNDYRARSYDNNGIAIAGNVSVGEFSFASGANTTASGGQAHAEGCSTIASGGFGSHAEGWETVASGGDAHAEGYSTIASNDGAHAEGCATQATGKQSHAEGYHTTASGNYSHASGYRTTASTCQFVTGYYNNVEPTKVPSAAGNQGQVVLFMIGNGTSTSGSNALTVLANGTAYVNGKTVTTGSDFAEYFEWLDQNPNNEDRRGRFVTLEGDKIKFASSSDDYILGVITGMEAVVGNAASDCWHNKYLTDVFGTRISQNVEIAEAVDEHTGEVIPAHIVTQFVENPNYNPDQEYVGREFRPEWAVVGMLGQIVVVDDGSCQVNGYCAPSVNGIGTAADSGYRVMKRIDETHIKVLVK